MRPLPLAQQTQCYHYILIYIPRLKCLTNMIDISRFFYVFLIIPVPAIRQKTYFYILCIVYMYIFVLKLP